jgi:hypothetical protein
LRTLRGSYRYDYVQDFFTMPVDKRASVFSLFPGSFRNLCQLASFYAWKSHAAVYPTFDSTGEVFSCGPSQILSFYFLPFDFRFSNFKVVYFRYPSKTMARLWPAAAQSHAGGSKISNYSDVISMFTARRPNEKKISLRQES